MALTVKCAFHSLSHVSRAMPVRPSKLLGARNKFNPLQCTRIRNGTAEKNEKRRLGLLNGGSRLSFKKKMDSDGWSIARRNVVTAASTETPPTGDKVKDVFSSPEGTCDPLCSVDDMSTEDFVETYKPREDLFKALVIAAVVFIGALAINHSWVAENQTIALWSVFVLGYAGIIFEESLAFNKSGVGLLMAVTLWTIRSLGASSPEVAVMELKEQATDVSEIVYFLLGAMTIVEIVDAHQGFKLVTDSITTRSPRLLLWVVGVITFFLSSILDNLTSTIVMVSLLRKLVSDPEQRKFLGGVVVIAANAGGAWTPIGDVTTTMLWINGQISTVKTMTDLFIPSAVSLAVPLALMSIVAPSNETSGSFRPADVMAQEQMAPRGRLVFGVGVGALLFVPVFKSLTGLPPYLGMLAGLGTLWVLTDAIHYGENPERQRLKVPQALSRIDTQGVLFFLGILLSVASLESAGLLRELANWLSIHLPNIELVAALIGIASAIIDNVPLVAATMGMYDMQQFPMDDELWQLIAYCAGTGGSILIIGSAAGVAYMGMEKADFVWYLKKVSGYALAGYLAGIACYLATSRLGLIGEVPVLAQATNVLPTDLTAVTAQTVDASQAMLAAVIDIPASHLTTISTSPIANTVIHHWEASRATLELGATQVADALATTLSQLPHMFV